MSPKRKAVLEALSDSPQGRKEIADEALLDPQQVSLELLAMSRVGLAKRTPDGWIKGDGVPTAEPPAEAERQAPAPIDVPVFTKPARGAKDRTPPPQRRKHQLAAPGVQTLPPESRIEYARFGEYVVVKKADLAQLLAVIHRWREVAVAVA